MQPLSKSQLPLFEEIEMLGFKFVWTLKGPRMPKESCKKKEKEKLEKCSSTSKLAAKLNCNQDTVVLV